MAVALSAVMALAGGEAVGQVAVSIPAVGTWSSDLSGFVERSHATDNLGEQNPFRGEGEVAA
jgi:hypothetical protein